MSIQYFPFSSIIETSFWSKLTEYKLSDLKLNVEPVTIWGTYNNQVTEKIPPNLTVHYDALESSKERDNDVIAPGILIITNTLEEFKKQPKAEILSKYAAEKIWKAIVDGSALKNPTVLASFLLYMFANLKTFKYHHWFGFSYFAFPDKVEIASSKLLKDVISEEQIREVFMQYYDKERKFCCSYFSIMAAEDEFQIYPLSSYISLREKNEGNIWLGFADPSSFEQPGWPLRNLLTLAAVQWPQYRSHTVLSLRYNVKEKCFGESLVLKIDLKGDPTPPTSMPKNFGWERNYDGKLGPKISDLKSRLDPARIAQTAVNLNLKLMRWRVAPDIDLDAISSCRCLILGAGTLGCNIARGLLGWGVKHISFVDYGVISYSNPVRQTLYDFEDCKQKNLKATSAAHALKKIYPVVKSQGYVFMIPMPDRSVSEKMAEEVKKDITQIEDLIEDHDAVFLVTDSRESRWLPTILGALHNKIVITVALGFDSFVVIRHGSLTSETKRLGCYFCTDVVTPVDTSADQTLDQQCTVSRPGTSFIASGHAVEMLSSILQHPLKVNAPADDDSSLFGPVPHSIRHQISTGHFITCAIPHFDHCHACGIKVVESLKKEGLEFILKVLNEANFLEKVSGLTQLHEDCADINISADCSSDSE